MSDNENRDKIILFAKSAGMSENDFKDAIADIYAGIVDMELDGMPEAIHEQASIFPGHKLVMTCHREFLN